MHLPPPPNRKGAAQPPERGSLPPPSRGPKQACAGVHKGPGQESPGNRGEAGPHSQGSVTDGGMWGTEAGPSPRAPRGGEGPGVTQEWEAVKVRQCALARRGGRLSRWGGRQKRQRVPGSTLWGGGQGPRRREGGDHRPASRRPSQARILAPSGPLTTPPGPTG